jgi:DNA-binding NtrC family response regulator
MLDRLVGEMVDKGIHYEDALREFQKGFITRVLQRHDFNLGSTARTLGVHRNTLTRKLQELKIKVRGKA